MGKSNELTLRNFEQLNTQPIRYKPGGVVIFGFQLKKFPAQYSSVWLK